VSSTSQDRPDEVLVLSAIFGDLDSFGELASRYRAAAVRTAQAIVGRDDAEDVAQEALMLAFKGLPSIEDPSRFAAWLGAITRHRAMRFSKMERRTLRVPLDEVLLEHVQALVLPLISEQETIEELNAALEEMPDEYSLVLRLRYLDEMPLKRISAFLGVPISTVKWRIHKGRELLRDKIRLLEKENRSGKG
jgi:RNA polymerase sigma-70 factor (ECF subfamily)